MQFVLACAAPHAAIPALVIGDRLALVRDGADLELRMKVTPGIIDRIMAALHDGALTGPPEGPRPTFEEIAEFIEARHAALVAEVEAKLVRAREGRPASAA